MGNILFMAGVIFTKPSFVELVSCSKTKNDFMWELFINLPFQLTDDLQANIIFKALHYSEVDLLSCHYCWQCLCDHSETHIRCWGELSAEVVTEVTKLNIFPCRRVGNFVYKPHNDTNLSVLLFPSSQNSISFSSTQPTLKAQIICMNLTECVTQMWLSVGCLPFLPCPKTTRGI